MGRMFVILLAVVVGTTPAFACKDKSDCSAGEICCMGTNWSSDNPHGSQTFGGPKRENGTCMSAKACARDDGTSVIYGPGAQCGAGTKNCTVIVNGHRMTGCFEPSRCSK